jgi:hypothetical protein
VSSRKCRKCGSIDHRGDNARCPVNAAASADRQ